MNTQTWAWIMWGASILCLPMIAWIFSNPKELGVKETRVLVAKRTSRQFFLFGLIGIPVEAFKYQFPVGSKGNEYSWISMVCLLLIGCTLVAMGSHLFTWFRTHPAIAETASDELVHEWKKKSLPRFMLLFALVIAVGRLVNHIVRINTEKPVPQKQQGHRLVPHANLVSDSRLSGASVASKPPAHHR